MDTKENHNEEIPDASTERFLKLVRLLVKNSTLSANAKFLAGEAVGRFVTMDLVRLHTDRTQILIDKIITHISANEGVNLSEADITGKSLVSPAKSPDFIFFHNHSPLKGEELQVALLMTKALSLSQSPELTENFLAGKGK